MKTYQIQIKEVPQVAVVSIEAETEEEALEFVHSQLDDGLIEYDQPENPFAEPGLEVDVLPEQPAPATRKWVVWTSDGYTSDLNETPTQNLQVLDFGVPAASAEEAVELVCARPSGYEFRRDYVTARELV